MYLGVDYYPEHWDTDLIDSDLERISALGANIIRIGEFAWHLIEKEEGIFDFSFFDNVIKKIKEYNLKIIFGTPTATFPAWLANKYPQILSVDENLQKRNFGGRRQYCFNSPEYNKLSLRITEKLVKHYSKEEAIVSWQIDNELGHEGSDLCFCRNCHQKFIKFLAEKYVSVEQLNNRYGTIFWGQTYNSFEEIPIPLKTVTIHNPSLMLDWARFRSYSLVRFANKQIKIVKKNKNSKQTVTTNLPGGVFDKYFCHEDLCKNLDFVSYDNYPVWGGITKPSHPSVTSMALDFQRGLKQKHFWIVEQLIGAQGHDVIGYLPRPNEAKLWAYQAFAHGCNNMIWFRWRAQTKGAEQFCLGLIDQNNRIGRKYKEVQSFIAEIKKYEDLINSEIKSDVAVIYDYDNIHSWKFQQQSSEFDIQNEILRLYKSFHNYNVNIDVISTKHDFSQYKVIVLPVMQILDHNLYGKIDKFTEKGGSVLFSFRSGIKDRDNNLYFDKTAPCLIKKMTGIEILEYESLGKGQSVAIKGRNDESSIHVWRDIIDTIKAESLYEYTDKFFKGKTCISRNRYKNADVYYIGAGVAEEVLEKLTKNILIKEKIGFIESNKNIEIYQRLLNGRKYLIIMNHSEVETTFNNIKLLPYECKVESLN